MIERIEMSLLKLPFVHFFETSFSREYDRTFIIIRVFENGLCGYGEVVAQEAPLYNEETTEGAWHILRDFLIPDTLREGISDPENFALKAGRFRGNLMAKAGLELALWDLEAKKKKRPAVPPLRRRAERNRDGSELRHREFTARTRGADRRLSRRGLPADQNQNQTGLGCRGLRGRQGKISGHRSPGGRQRRLHPCRQGDAQGARRIQPSPRRTAVRASRSLGSRQASEGNVHAGLSRRKRYFAGDGAGGARDGKLPDRQYQSRPGRRDLRRRKRSTIIALPAAFRSGAAACWRAVSAGPTISISPLCPISNCLTIFRQANVIIKRISSNRPLNSADPG